MLTEGSCGSGRDTVSASDWLPRGFAQRKLQRGPHLYWGLSAVPSQLHGIPRISLLGRAALTPALPALILLPPGARLQRVPSPSQRCRDTSGQQQVTHMWQLIERIGESVPLFIENDSFYSSANTVHFTSQSRR